VCNGLDWFRIARNFTENFNFHDVARKRRGVSIHIYFNEAIQHHGKIPVVLLNPGGVAPSTSYSYLANFLADNGYAVVCVEHNRIGDEPHDLEKFNTGIMKEARRPIWELWTANLEFVITCLKQEKPNFNLDKFIIAGHSTGGDVSMFFTEKHPDLVSHVISLDGRRCPFPRNAHVRILLLQATDTTTDEGVIPSEDEPNKLTEVRVIRIPNALHNDYADRGTDAVHASVIEAVSKFLNLPSHLNP
jgi:dienelactone hydrolase